MRLWRVLYRDSLRKTYWGEEREPPFLGLQRSGGNLAMALGAGWSPNAETADWDDLRKQARKLESELDVKLASFRRVGTPKGGQGDGSEAEIERLLQQLNEVNKHLQSWVSNARSDVLSHTLARHRNILHELSQEFARIRVNAKASREHAELLHHFSRGDERNSFMDDEGFGLQQQSLLREQAAINRSTSQMDSVIGHAQEAYNALRYQRSTFGDISTKISTISTKLPSVNSILTAIRRRRSRDTLILGAVASLCTILILLYWLTK